VTAVLVDKELIGVRGSASGDPDLVWKAAEFYVAKLADTIPILEIGDTLHWHPTFELTTATGGTLLLAYKCLLLLPLIQLVAIVLKRSFGELKPEPVSSA
jgi:hypothetical protein